MKRKETASLKGGLTFATSIHPYDAYGQTGGRMKRTDDLLYGEGLLGESLAPKKSGELARKFSLPPFSVLSAREGWWQDRKRAWLSIGIQSELGRGGDPTLDATPGGSLMPAANYSAGQRGDGPAPAITILPQQYDKTQVEQRGDIWIKRDDLFVVAGSAGGKARTCLALAQGAVGLVTAGSRSSPQINIVAGIAHELGIPCRAHTPQGELSPELLLAKKRGAEIIQHKAGYNSVIIARAREDAAQRGWTEIPFGMECQEAITQTRGQVTKVDDAVRIVVPVGSGMSLAGILWGLLDQQWAIPVVGVVVGSDPTKRLDTYAPPNWRDMVSLVPSGSDYHVPAATCEFHGINLDPFYEAKASKVVAAGDLFWIVGCRQSVKEAPAVAGPASELPPLPVEMAPAAPRVAAGAPLLPVRSTWVPPAEYPSLAGCQRICLDVETRDEQLADLGPGDVRDRKENYIVGLALGTDDGRRFYFPVRHDGGGNMDAAQTFGWARDALNSFAGEVVGARIIYDLGFLANEGVTLLNVKRFRDIQIAEPLLDEHRLSYNLDTLAKVYLGAGKDETLLRQATAGFGWKTDKDVKKNLWRLPANFVGAYAEADVDLPLRILPLQESKLGEEKLLEVWELESKLIPLLLAMRRRGVKVDLELAQQVRERMVAVRDAALAQVRRYAGPAAELMAADSLGPALADRGLDVPRTPKTGGWSITKGWLANNAHDPLAAAIMEGRRVQTIIGTFLDGHILGHHVNGRIHCEFNQLKGDEGGTIARFSSSNPNLQNIPSRDEELGPLIRSIFVPEEGELWGRADYSQIEYRMLVHYARGRGADEARAAYCSDPKTDYHKFCATLAEIDPEDKSRRKAVKGLNFAKGYGAQAPRLASILGVSINEAKAFIELYERKLPFTKTTFDAFASVAKERGNIRTLLGRLQRFPFWEPRGFRSGDRESLPLEQAKAKWPGQPLQRAMTYAALNRGMQGSAADLMKKAMVDTWESGICDVLGAPLLTVHDELDESIPDSSVGREAWLEQKAIMERAVTLRVPIIAETDLGANWGACA